MYKNSHDVEKIIDSSNATDIQKLVLKVLLQTSSDLLRRTGARETAKGLETIGATYLLDETGNLKGPMYLDLTLQTIDAMMREKEKAEVAKTLPEPVVLFKQLRLKPNSFGNVDRIDEAMSQIQKLGYVRAVHTALGGSGKAQKILQDLVNFYTGHGDTTIGYLNGPHSADSGLNYISRVLELPKEADKYGYSDHHAAIKMLDRCLSDLPRNPVDLDAKSAPAAKITKGQVAPEKQEEINGLISMFFRKPAAKNGGPS